MQSTTMVVQTLTGNALDYAVDRAVNGHKYGVELALRRTANESGFHPSASWSQCGPLISEYGVAFTVYPGEIHACVTHDQHAGNAFGESHLQAACRAIANARHGNRIEIPVELISKK